MTEDEKKYRDHLEGMVEKRTAELKEEIAKLKNAEKNLKSERDKLQSFMDALDYTGIGVDIVGVDYKIVFQNETLKRKFGDLTGELCYEKYMGLKEPCEFCPMKKAIETGKPQTVGLTAIDGRDYQLFSAPIQNRDGSVDKVAEVVIDITERKKAEEKIKASLKEKDVMLREIYHRVKNNMQIVSSLLRLQSAKVKGKKIKEVFRECQNRIRTMSIIHERLYQSKDLAKIDYAQYIDGLAVHIFQSYGVDSNLVVVKTDLEEVFLDLNRAVPCGLIINELLSNSVKHAFPEGEKGEICVNLHSDKKGMITLVVSDNGIGLPDDIDFRKAQSLGLQMVNDLTKQIGGTIELDCKGGTAFKVKFPVNK